MEEVLLIEKKLLKLENEIIEEHMRKIKQYARKQLNNTKLTQPKKTKEEK